MTKSIIIKGLTLDMKISEKFRKTDATFINVRDGSIFEHTFYHKQIIRKYLYWDEIFYGQRRDLAIFRCGECGMLHFTGTTYYHTHQYAIATVLGTNSDKTKLQLHILNKFPDTIIYETSNTKNFPYIEFIERNDELLIKYPKNVGEYIQIIANITQNKKLYSLNRESVRLEYEEKYTLSPTGVLLTNKRKKER